MIPFGTFATIFVDNILPLFLAIGAGVLVDRLLGIDRKGLTHLGLYVLIPCLVFAEVAGSEVSAAEYGLMIGYAVANLVAMLAISAVAGKVLGWSARSIDALILSVAFVNAGNLGLPAVLLSYGEAGLAWASAYFVVAVVAGCTVAGGIAARSSGGHRAVARAALQTPGLYAFGAAFVLRLLDVPIPTVALALVDLLGQAAMPLMLLILGMQLSITSVSKRYREVGVGVLLRLVLGPLVAVPLATLFGLHGLPRAVGILQASMPTGVSSNLMAVEFSADADYVTNVTLFSTLLSAVSLSIVVGLS